MEDNIRAPLPNQRINMFDPYDGESIEDYVSKINNDNNIDSDMKEILIQSRREFLGLNKVDNIAEQIDISYLNNEIIIRASKISPIAELITSNPELKSILVDKLDKFINVTTDFIKLEPPEYIKVFEIIEKAEFDNETCQYLNNIIIPYDLNSLNEYKIILEKTKREHEELISKKLLIENRYKDVQIFINYLNKLSKFDQTVNILAKNIEPYIKKYIQLETDIIKLDNGLDTEVKKFIRSIRIKDTDLIIISNLFQL